VRLQSAPGTAVAVEYVVEAGTATPGEDFVAEQGSVTFAAGQAERVIPVRVLDDRVTEGRETVLVSLTEAGKDVVVGSPSMTRVVIDDNVR
jgi:hypothetical protein